MVFIQMLWIQAAVYIKCIAIVVRAYPVGSWFTSNTKSANVLIHLVLILQFFDTVPNIK
jgi:hypothetical protein